MIKSLLLSVLILLIFSGSIYAQGGRRGLVDKSDESQSYLTISLGPEYCESDEQGSLSNQINLNNNDFSIGIRKLYSNNFAYKFVFNFSNFSGNDEGYLGNRVYTFTSNVMQLALQGEYHIKIGRAYYYKPTANSIYVFLGVGVLRSNATLNTNNDVRGNYIYKPISYAPVFPAGLGYQYNMNNGFLIGGEFNLRYPISDYIDGFKPPTVTINGNTTVSKSNDILGGFSFTLTWLLGSDYLRRN